MEQHAEPPLVRARKGLIQGDPAAVAVVAVLMAAWISLLESRLRLPVVHDINSPLPRNAIFFKVYVDDCTVLLLQNHIANFFQCVRELDQRLGWQLQAQKLNLPQVLSHIALIISLLSTICVLALIL